jgi:phosphate transport system permease protein
MLYLLNYYSQFFEETPEQRNFIDRSVRYILIAFALSAIIIVFLIIIFTMSESWEAITEIGLDTMLMGTIWRPGSIIGTDDAQFGLIPMVVGSILSTIGAALIGVPLSILTAILLSEVAPQAIRETIRPMIELLAGIPSVVYGLFGMVVLAPMIRIVEIPYNTGFGLLNASIILAVMIIPTVTNIAEDAIRAVPREFKEGSLALGTTHWQTIWNVILPAARSGIIAAIILGIGRALGETMALIMVIGNTIALPKPLTENPLTILLATARTLTGNIAVEINYAAGPHRSALFFTGILLFLMIFLVNSIARYLMRERLSS